MTDLDPARLAVIQAHMDAGDAIDEYGYAAVAYLLAALARLQAENRSQHAALDAYEGVTADITDACDALKGDAAAAQQEVIFFRDAANAQRERAEQAEADLARLQAARDENNERLEQYHRIANMSAVAAQVGAGRAMADCVEVLIDKIDTERCRAIKRAEAAEAARDEAQRELTAIKLKRARQRVGEPE